MTERELAQEGLAEYERWAASHPDAPGIDASDLAAIGAARSKPGITREQVAELVQTAQAHGRTWSEIADRLGMSPAQAMHAYGAKPGAGGRRDPEPPQTIISAMMDALADALQWGAKALNNAASTARHHARH